MSKRYAVIGLGRFGRTLATHLAQNSAEVMAIDINPELVAGIKDEVAFAATMDARDEKGLKNLQLHEMDAVVVAIGADFESMLLCSVNLMNLVSKDRLYTRAMNDTQKNILEMIGFEDDHVICPELERATTLAHSLMTPNLLSSLTLPDDHEIVEIVAPKLIHNKTLAEIHLRKRYHLNLITIKRPEEYHPNHDAKTKTVEHLITIPMGETQILEGDKLFLIGKTEDVERFISINA